MEMKELEACVFPALKLRYILVKVGIFVKLYLSMSVLSVNTSKITIKRCIHQTSQYNAILKNEKTLKPRKKTYSNLNAVV